MSIMPVKPRARVTGKTGRESGAGMGQRIGAGLGAIIGGAPGAIAGNPLAAVKGATEGAMLGGGFGGMAGGMIQPGRANTQQVQQGSGPSLVQTAAQSQQLLSGIQSLEFLDENIQQEMTQPLTQAYIASMVKLKNSERGIA